jgi:hypothetical protein
VDGRACPGLQFLGKFRLICEEGEMRNLQCL